MTERTSAKFPFTKREFAKWFLAQPLGAKVYPDLAKHGGLLCGSCHVALGSPIHRDH